MSNESRQNKNNPHKLGKGRHTYCVLATGEDHEYQECKRTGKFTAYGIDKKIGKDWLEDKVIGNWVKYFVNDSSE